MRSKISTVVAVVLLTVAAQSRAQQLNNLVNQVLNTTTPTASHNFTNAREGWVHIRIPTPAGVPNAALPVAVIDGQTVALRRVGNHLEAMRYVSQGQHAIQINANGAASVGRLQVRAIGELSYTQYGQNPLVPETGNYSWEYLRKNRVLDSYNQIVSALLTTPDGKSKYEKEIVEWTGEGRRWYTEAPVPFDAGMTADDVYDYWTSYMGLSHPLMSGIWANEFGIGMRNGVDAAQMYPAWTEAVRRIGENPQYDGKTIYAYGPNRLLPGESYQQMVPFIQTMMAHDYRFAVEWYIVEERSRPGRIINNTDDLIQVFSPSWEAASRQSWEALSTGSASNRLIAMGLLSQPEESLNIFPHSNFNVFLDAQFRFIATDSAFAGARGVQGYLSGYTGEEQTRLYADLVRHYFIEGRTDLMLKSPYILTHLKNPDFENGTADWTIQPAAGGSVTTKSAPGFGFLQGRFHAPAGLGDVGLWTKRNASGANVISQTVQDLIPGRLYSLRFFTGDYQDLLNGVSQKKLHGVSVDITNADILNDLSFQAIIQNNYGHAYGPFNVNHRYWMNYYQRVFKALDETALLRLSDWAAAGSPGGPIGQELVWNFVQLQPYYQNFGYKILEDDFESVNNGQLPVAQIGTRYAGNAKVGGTLASAPTVGRKYLLIDRAAGVSDNVWYDLEDEPITANSNKIHFEFFLNAISGHAAFGLTTTSEMNVAHISNGIINLVVLPDGSVQALGNTSVYADTGLSAVLGKWQLWQIDYTVGASSFDLSVGGDTVTLVGGDFMFDPNASQLNSLYFATSSGATKYLVDDLLVTLVPEPGAALLWTAGAVFLSRKFSSQRKIHAN